MIERQIDRERKREREREREKERKKKTKHMILCSKETFENFERKTSSSMIFDGTQAIPVTFHQEEHARTTFWTGLIDRQRDPE